MSPDKNMIEYNYSPFKKVNSEDFKTNWDVILWLMVKKSESIALDHWTLIDLTISKIINLPLKVANCLYVNL